MDRLLNCSNQLIVMYIRVITLMRAVFRQDGKDCIPRYINNGHRGTQYKVGGSYNYTFFGWQGLYIYHIGKSCSIRKVGKGGSVWRLIRWSWYPCLPDSCRTFQGRLLLRNVANTAVKVTHDQADRWWPKREFSLYCFGTRTFLYKTLRSSL